MSLTAWVVQFMCEARAAGFQINEKLFNTYIQTLKQALRSDYTYYVTGTAYAERCWALNALATAGQADSGYAVELARKADYLNLESAAQVVYALCSTGSSEPTAIDALNQKLWRQIVIQKYQGRKIYGGLTDQAVSGNALILPSETRTVAEALRAVAACESASGSDPENRK